MGKRREQLNEFYRGMKELNKTNPDQINGFNVLLNSELKDGILNVKTKELISVSIACFTRCEYCIVYHVYKAIKCGASAEEIQEAAFVSVVFGGGPSIAYIATVLRECLVEFEDDLREEK